MAQLTMHVICVQSASYTFMRRKIDNHHFLRTLGVKEKEEPIFINCSYGDTDNTNSQLGNIFLTGGRWQPREGNIRNKEIKTMFYIPSLAPPPTCIRFPTRTRGRYFMQKTRASMATLQ